MNPHLYEGVEVPGRRLCRPLPCELRILDHSDRDIELFVFEFNAILAIGELIGRPLQEVRQVYHPPTRICKVLNMAEQISDASPSPAPLGSARPAVYEAIPTMARLYIISPIE